ncbi:hypothetical protein [Chromobacterium violaceum]|uniref:hypothetical protein n=1 Tax=Chromobacterium violaceum TaxID=536 RepID=UPI0012D3555F|nr:hypothetical protein [Chromobacterium violaceum]
MKYLHDKSTFRVKDLLQLHDDWEFKHSLPNHLADGFVLQNNSLAFNIRENVISLGYRFSTCEMSECKAWPLMSLDYILEKKIIPYDDSVSIMRHVESKYPGRFTLLDLDQISRPNTSSALHEACHAVFDSAFKQKKSNSMQPNNILCIFEGLLGESFVGASETFVSYFSKTKLEVFIVEKFHSLVSVGEDCRRALNYIISQIGFHAAFEIMVLAYLHYNFLAKNITVNNLKAVLDALGMPELDNDDALLALQEIFNHAMSMNQTARVYTALNYQYFMGVSQARTAKEYLDIINFNFMEIYFGDDIYRKIISSLSSIMFSAA